MVTDTTWTERTLGTEIFTEGSISTESWTEVVAVGSGFYRGSSDTQTDQTPPVIITTSVHANVIGTNYARLDWDTDEEANCRVRVATTKPPAMATASAKTTTTGSITAPATNRGRTRYRTGSMAMVSRASICSVTLMVPSSAAIEAPTRPPTTRAVSTGPSSTTTDFPITVPR